MSRMNPRALAAILIIVGGAVVLLGTFAFSGDTAAWTIVVGVILSQGSLPLLLSNTRSNTSSTTQRSESTEQSREDLEDWFETQTERLQAETDRLQQRQRSLTEQFNRVQEFLEYPVAEAESFDGPERQVRLSVNDLEVRKILEAEAERVYEKIRENGYSKNGVVDTQQIRDEIIDLVERVARVYNPNSENPLLETSFEQLARAASRICLHSLVLLEQLPLDVKTYNIRQIYDYIRHAVSSYGAYQQVSPWLKRLSRGAYVGRLVAGANPVSLGAWWLATEIGRRGATKIVENVVDRQAVGALNDLVAIVGTEAANIYAPGFRQRDPGWVYGAELTELLHRFPISRESLVSGLREITSLRLRSEYDRIYLYRCVADHRSAGLRVADPAILSRPEREEIAARLEKFFTETIHGVTPTQLSEWKEDVEERLDLKLHLGHSTDKNAGSLNADAAVRAVHAFACSVADANSEDVVDFLESQSLMNHVTVDRRIALLKECRSGADIVFAPPDLEPSSELTKTFLEALLSTTVACGSMDGNIESLLIETCCFYRRGREEAAVMLDTAFRQFLERRCADHVKLNDVPIHALRVLRSNIQFDEKIHGVFAGVSAELHEEDSPFDIDGAFIVMGNEQRRAILIHHSDIAWESDSSVQIHREKGYFIDDCAVTGGKWNTVIVAGKRIVLAGRLTSQKFDQVFAAVLQLRN